MPKNQNLIYNFICGMYDQAKRTNSAMEYTPEKNAALWVFIDIGIATSPILRLPAPNKS